MRALVVDDSKATRTIIRSILNDLQVEVVEAADSAQALVELERASFDVALVDWNMPGLDGIELVRTLRASEAYQGLRIVMVTTETEIKRVATALQAGADEYIMKPFTEDMVREKLMLLGLFLASPEEPS